MNRFAHRSLSSLLLLTSLAASNAFAPLNHQLQHHAIAAAPSSYSKVQSSISRRVTVLPITTLRQSSNDDESSSIINIALITSTTTTTNYNDELQKVLKEHPFCKFSGVQLSFSDVDVSTSSWSKENIAILQQAEMVCFDNMSAVKSYLKMLDSHLNAAEDISDDDRKKLPNKPDIVGDILGNVENNSGGATFMAACPNASTARVCLNSGRWMSNHIYYPKETQEAVELKAEPIDSDVEGEAAQEEEVDEDVDSVEVWADSVAQAAGDVHERRFWGGGW